MANKVKLRSNASRVKEAVQRMTGSYTRMLNLGARKDLARRIRNGRNNPEVNAFYKQSIKRMLGK